MMIAVISTCFNRADTTLRGLYALRLAAKGIDYRVYLVDDGSTDGTGNLVAATFPEVQVINGDGTLYWNKGMRLAWSTALCDGADYYLWWNDDLELISGVLPKLLAFQNAREAAHGPKVISIGKVVDPDSGAVTYGGYRVVPGLSKLRFRRSDDDGQACDTMNGNCVLVPACAVGDIGTHSSHYSHSSGDVDYGLRAVKAGYKLFQTPFPVGRTAYNTQFGVKMSRLTWSNRHFVLRHPKGIPVTEWMHFCRTHGGPLWPINFLARYLKIMRLRT